MPVDPSAVKTWANLVTVARVLIAPFMFVLIPDEPGGSWVAFALWFVLCSTDGIDGYLARRHGSTTVGAFLDPLADKVSCWRDGFLVKPRVLMFQSHHRRCATCPSALSNVILSEGCRLPPANLQVKKSHSSCRSDSPSLPLTRSTRSVVEWASWTSVVLAIIAMSDMCVLANRGRPSMRCES